MYGSARVRELGIAGGLQDSRAAASTVKGKIVITRYGNGWRGLKPSWRRRRRHRCIIYSDPRDDGYSGVMRTPRGAGARPAACSAARWLDMGALSG